MFLEIPYRFLLVSEKLSSSAYFSWDLIGLLPKSWEQNSSLTGSWRYWYRFLVNPCLNFEFDWSLIYDKLLYSGNILCGILMVYNSDFDFVPSLFRSCRFSRAKLLFSSWRESWKNLWWIPGKIFIWIHRIFFCKLPTKNNHSIYCVFSKTKHPPVEQDRIYKWKNNHGHKKLSVYNCVSFHETQKIIIIIRKRIINYFWWNIAYFKKLPSWIQLDSHHIPKN